MNKMSLLIKIEQAANSYNKTKKDRYKKEWYRLVKKFSDWASSKYNKKK
tara:strand:+ start:109 stop:255 length:147 start_codon:yes stop_codon:yes gene_type:complete